MKKKIIKVISVFMVLNIFLIPLTNFAPCNQIKTVQASEGIIDIRFFNAVISMIGITAAGLATMSPSFTIPEADLVEMKNSFAQTLEADAVKKQAWLSAQTDYLAGGIAKTMGAVELAKIGINDIYNQFKDYIENNYIQNKVINNTILNLDNTSFSIINNSSQYTPGYGYSSIPYFLFTGFNLTSNFMVTNSIALTNGNPGYNELYRVQFIDASGNVIQDKCIKVEAYRNDTFVYLTNQGLNEEQTKILLSLISSLGIPYTHALTNSIIHGNISNNNLLNSTDTTRSIIPTIPWIDTTVPIGTIVTPAIAAPYAGAVPIDVPITAPIDPPIEEPVDPPADVTLIGTVAAILAGITPISAILDNILASELDIADVIEVGITGVIDGITDIQSSLSTLTAPATETINLDPVKNIPSVLFTKFPFSIPWDLFNVYNLMATDNRSPPEFSLGIPMTKSLNLSSFGVSDIKMDVKLENYEEIAGIVRTAELLLFVIGLIFATKKLIWG